MGSNGCLFCALFLCFLAATGKAEEDKAEQGRSTESYGQLLMKEVNKELFEYVLEKVDNFINSAVQEQSPKSREETGLDVVLESPSDDTNVTLPRNETAFCTTMKTAFIGYAGNGWSFAFPIRWLLAPITLPLYYLGYYPLRAMRDVACIKMTDVRQSIGNVVNTISHTF